MRLGHVVAPQDHGVGLLDVGVDVRRLVDAEDLIEGHDRAGHAQARIGIDVVAAEARLHQLAGGVGLGDGVLAGADDGHRARALGFIGLAELALHLVHRHFPAHRLEGRVLVELAVLHAHQRLRQAVGAVEDLAVEVALDAVQPPVHRRVGVALGGDHLAALGADQDPAARAAESAHALVPGDPGLGRLGLGGSVLADGQAHGQGGRGGDARLDEVATVDGVLGHGRLLRKLGGEAHAQAAASKR